MALRSITYRNKELKIVNQLLLPGELKYEEITTVEEAFDAIKKMKIRGAPAIAIFAMLSIAIESKDLNELVNKQKLRRLSKLDYYHYLEKQCDYLCSARPTAVNIRIESKALLNFYQNLLKVHIELEPSVELLIKEIEKLIEIDVNKNTAIAKFGANHIVKYWSKKGKSDELLNILTICNTGNLATAGVGTALGVVSYLHQINKLNCCYCTETRPYLQGSRLTAYELCYEKINSKLICDNMIAYLMKKEKIHAVVVGADRLVLNGDFANKIGTYQMALLAKEFSVPFYVACPISTIDFNTKSGEDIFVEERPEIELKFIGTVQIAPDEIKCLNPAFDVTPNELITGGIITEKGVFNEIGFLKQ